MEPIDGVDLVAEFAAAKAVIIKAKQDAIRVKLGHVLGSFSESQGSVARLEKELAKAKDKASKLQSQIDLLAAGNWSALKEDEKTQ